MSSHLTLIVDDPLRPCLQIALRQFPAIVGRDEAAHIRLRDAWLSGRHCELNVCGDAIFVRDLNSTNGTFVNGHRTLWSELNDGDCLTVGITRLTVERGEANNRDTHAPPDGFGGRNENTAFCSDETMPMLVLDVLLNDWSPRPTSTRPASIGAKG